MVDKLLLLLFLFGALSLIFVSAKVYETEDAIIIEGKFWLLFYDKIPEKKLRKSVNKILCGNIH